MADQCIVCLENLDVQLSDPSEGSSETSQQTNETTPTTGPVDLSHQPPKLKDPATTPPVDDENKVALIAACNHVLHDACLRAWSGKANSCPICRHAFHLVHVYDKVGGTQLSSYRVEDRKQVAEFDAQEWLDENPEEEESTPCPICNLTNNEDVLLLCDACDAPYHTYCVDLESVPRGHWFCMECADQAADLLFDEVADTEDTVPSNQRSAFMPRTLASMRRARRTARSDEWQGAWGQLAGRVYDVLNIDLDNVDDDEALRNYRRSQQVRERDRREYQRWQQRFNIASRAGAREVFADNISNVLPQRVRRQQPPPPPPEETPEEVEAWGALEKAMEASSPDQTTPNRRKRKSRSVTASPIEPPQAERKLKRPRTRRVPTQSEASSSRAAELPERAPPAPEVPQATARSLPIAQNGEVPSFLSSLLKEVEMSTPSDDENVRALFGPPKSAADPSSPGSSPSPSAYSSPRALSTTPPPRGINDRPGSPLSLTSRIEPVYPPANYLPMRNGGGDSNSNSRSPEIQQPRPRRQHAIRINTNTGSSIMESSPTRRSPTHHSPTRPAETSPTRGPLPIETKESISGIVKDALKPHWKSGHITADQYAAINRDLSRKLYEEVTKAALNDDDRQRCEKIASKEVARAVADLKA